MFRYIRFLPVLIVMFFLASCREAPVNPTWESDWRFGLDPNVSNVRHYLIPQSFDPASKTAGTFYLYYFTKGPTRVPEPGKPIKTILFCAGGPGQVFWPLRDQLFLSALEQDYRVVYFHLRGAGFSQLPASNAYDMYLRTNHAVRDIETIFDHLAENDPNFLKWDAVVGLSYGTVLAQQYTAKNPTKVEKLVLASPLSRHPFKKPTDDPERKKFVNDLAGEHGVLLEHIFNTDTFDKGGVWINTFKEKFPNFFDLVERPDYNRNQIIKDIVKEVSGIFATQENVSLSVSPLMDFYDDLKTSIKEDKTLNNQQLTILQTLARYDRQFLIDMRDLRNAGWGEAAEVGKDIEGVSEAIAARALRIAAQVLMFGPAKIDVREKFKDKFGLETDDLCKSIAKPEWRKEMKEKKDMNIEEVAKKHGIWQPNPLLACRENEIAGTTSFVGSRRVFYNMAIYDGLDSGFLDNWTLDSRTEIRDFLKKRGWWQIDPFLRNIGFVQDEIPQIWDPGDKRYHHDVPTLILRGKADPITAGKQANYIFEEALSGPRYLIEFDGVGHDLNIPGIHQVIAKEVHEGAKTVACGFKFRPVEIIHTRPCIIESFITDRLEAFRYILAQYHNKYSGTSGEPYRISPRPVTCASSGVSGGISRSITAICGE